MENQARYLRGSTGGLADMVPATIEGSQPAALSHGEVVIPADVVSMLGDGNSEAGAKVLMEFVAKIRQLKTGSKSQSKSILDLLEEDSK